MPRLGPRWSPRRTVTAAALIAALALTGCADGSGPDAASAPAAASGSAALDQAPFLTPRDLDEGAHGIRISAARQLSDRAVELTVDTAAVSHDVPGGPNTVVIVLPRDYDPARRYASVYLLGGSGPNSTPERQWYGEGQAEELTAGLPVITVIPSGGKEGWYTDWSHSEQLAQQWATYHLDQLVPWVDEHLPTRPDRKQRLVLGNSMGGYGAVRYAQQRPDLFGEAVSLSGLLDLSSKPAQDQLREASHDATGEWNALFGDGNETTDEQWRAHDPVVQADSLRNVTVQLFAGAGDGSAGDIEPALRDTSEQLARALQHRGSAYEYTMYGQPEGCEGTHSFLCWRPAASVALARWASRAGLTDHPSPAPVPSEYTRITRGETP